ncbi:MAG: 3-hydroxyacyl-CoA dehydrogenase NAD-binding domain-containing protein [Pseudomonadota bacterium]
MTEDHDPTAKGPVGTRVEGGVAVISIDNPPVNALSQAVRQGLLEALAAAQADDAVIAIVVLGAGRTFIAGADIREFGQPPAGPGLSQVIDALEASAKPVTAAIHGVALGGGLELALGCHYRVAAPEARVGLPEVALGLIPGAGGTQRLPRLVGVEAAVDLITSGRHVPAPEARELEILDALAEGDLRPFAIAFARDNAETPPRRLCDQAVEPPPAEFFQVQARKVAARAKGQESPLRALDAIRAATEAPSFAAGLAQERDIFVALKDSDQSKALRHVFFAERAAAKPPGLAASAPRPVASLGVVGGGTMGGGIATAALRAGLPVTLVERDDEAAKRAAQTVAVNLEGFVARGRMTAAAKEGALETFTATSEIGDIAQADLVIEAVFEDMAVKQAVFARLDRIAKPGAVLATNTSYLDVNEIAAATGRPADVLGLHFFSPAQLMRLIEIVQGDRTAPEVLATGFALAKRLGKVGVLAGVCDGFIGNRILRRTRQLADALLEDGALPWQIDRAMEAFGMAMGLYKVLDLAGLDIGWAERKRRAATRDPKARYVAIADRICERGWFGRKTGRGWYRYEGGKPLPDPEVEAIILAESGAKGIVRRAIDDQEIQDRMVCAMINEAAAILEEKIARRPLDVDLIEILGYGFPRWRGGPLFHGDTIGLDRVRASIERFARDDPEAWSPAPLIDRLVAEGKTFASLN